MHRTGGQPGHQGPPPSGDTLATIVELGDQMAAEVDDTGTIRWANSALCRCLDRRADDLVGRPAASLFHPETSTAIPPDAFEGKASFSGTARVKTASGGDRWIELALRPLPAREGRCGGGVLVGTDRTDLTAALQTAEDTRAENDAYRSATEGHSLVSIADRRGRIIDVNESFCRVSGYTREELIGQDHRILNSGIHDKAFWQTMWRTVARGESWRREVCNRTKDGSLYWVDSIVVPHLDAAGRPERYVSIRVDITRRKEAEAEARSMALHMKGDNADAVGPHGRIDISPNGTVRDVSDSMLDALGYERGELVGLPYTTIVPEDEIDSGQHQNLWDELIRGRCAVCDVRRIGSDGAERVFHASFIPVFDPRGAVERIVEHTIAPGGSEQSRRELEQLQARFERATRATTDGLWEYNRQTGYMWYSDSFKALVGLKPHEYADFEPTLDSFLNLLHPDDTQRTINAINEHLDTGRPYDIEYRLRMRNGSFRWFRARGAAVTGDNGDHERTAGSVIDIHDQHTARSRLDLAARAAGIGLWDWDVRRGDTYFSDTWYTMLGYEPNALPMEFESWRRITHPEDLDRVLEQVEEHIAQRTERYDCEHRVRAASGAWRWVRAVGEVVERDENGAPLRMTGVVIDVQALHDARGRVEDQRTELQAIIDAIPGFVYYKDDQNTILDLNRTAAESIGLPRDEIRGRPTEAFFPPEYAAKYLADDLEVINEKEPRIGIIEQYEAENGTRLHIRTDKIPLRGPSGSFDRLVAIATDITEITEAKEQAEAASIAKSEFLANMSHEIRTPMTAILGYADLLTTDEQVAHDTDAAAEAVTAIRSNARHLMTVINDILDLSRIEAGRLEIECRTVKPARLIRETVDLVTPPASQKGLSVKVDISEELPPALRTDPTRLRQVLLNLLHNAIKFTPSGEVHVQAESNTAPGTVTVRVIDTGIGIGPDTLERIRAFEPFTQADSSMTRRFGGSGLGLRISNALIEMLGGELEIDSLDGHGTTCTVTIPIQSPLSDDDATPDDSTGDDPAEANEPASLEGLSVLLVEDGIDNQRLIAHHLRKAGAEVSLATDGFEALEFFNATADDAQLDVVLMDMQMPGLDGYEATRRLRARGHRIPILALTAHAMAGDRDRCIAAGCSDYLTKPIDARLLRATIARWARPNDTDAAA